MIVRASGRGGNVGWLFSDIEPHEDNHFRLVDIDEDRYGGAYSGATFTAWPGTRPSDIDAGDIDCEDFWRTNRSNMLHGRGSTAQEAYLDLLREMTQSPFYFDPAFQVVFVGQVVGEPSVFVVGSEEFEKWLRVS